MTHRCRVKGSSVACFEENNELWVKEYADGNEYEGRTYQVKFCPECGFKIPKASFAKSFFSAHNIHNYQSDDIITKFSQSLSTAIAQMNHNVELIKEMMSAQNAQNECFIERDLYSSQEISYIKRRLEVLESK